MEPSRELKGSEVGDSKAQRPSLYLSLGKTGKNQTAGLFWSPPLEGPAVGGRPRHTPTPPRRASLYPLLGAPNKVVMSSESWISESGDPGSCP